MQKPEAEDSRLQLLIVEDNPGDRDLLIEHLDMGKTECDVRTASTLAEAVDLLGDNPHVAAILLDLGLPDSQGVNSVKNVLEAAPTIAIVVLTGHDDERTAEAALRAGAQDYLVKGHYTPEVLDRVIRYSRERKAQSARIEHLNRVLAAIRDINQLIVRDKEPHHLIEEACRILVESRGYDLAWISLLDADEQPALIVHAEYNHQATEGVEPISERYVTPCTRYMLEHPGRMTLLETEELCVDCELSKRANSRSSAVCRIAYDGTTYGFLGVKLPELAADPDEELDLLVEVAGDVAFALAAIELEAKRHEQEKRFRSLYDTMAQGVVYQDAEGRIIDANPAAERILGLSLDQMQGRTSVDPRWNTIHEDGSDFPGEEHYSMQALASGEVKSGVMGVFNPKHNRHHWILVCAVPEFRPGESKPHRVFATFEDITEIRDAQEQLASSENRFRSFVENANDIVYELNPDGTYAYASPNWLKAVDMTLDELVGMSFVPFIHPDDLARCNEFLETILQDPNGGHTVDYRVKVKDGEWRWHSSSGSVVRDENGDVLSFVGIARDFTEEKLAEEALIESEANHRTAQRVASIGHWELWPDADTPKWSEEVFHIFGLDPEEGEPSMEEHARLLHPEDLGIMNDAIDRALNAGTPYTIEFRFYRPDGTLGWMREIGQSVANDDGTIQKIFGTAQDITELKVADIALRESERRFRSVIEQSNDAIYILFGNQFDLVNQQFCNLLGYTTAEILSPEFNMMDCVAPDDRDLVRQRIEQRNSGVQPDPVYEFTVLRKDGTRRVAQASVTEILYQDGHAVLGFLRDITEQRALEYQFRQSQKMESVGRLAGGVAHDFNNMLQTIIGNAEIALLDESLGDEMNELLDEIMGAANRSADLTRQLLAFARQQTIKPVPVNLNDAIVGMLKMLQRLIGEDIQLTWLPEPSLWTTKIDRGQVDQILANLTVNARDAIDGPGRITVETLNAALDEDYASEHSEVDPGEYVMVAVTDTGSGMDKEVAEKIFEPFFTTKKQGEGTGLGLATVYGIVKQNRGSIHVYSEVGEGTTFKIYLPRHLSEQEVETVTPDTTPLKGGSETILLVEDESSILRLGERILQTLGYTVLVAHGPESAIALVEESTTHIDLLITDVVMPEMNGRELAEQISAMRPEIAVLYMSGYTANVIANRGVLKEGVNFIQKPFTTKNLGEKVRSVLDKSSNQD